MLEDPHKASSGWGAEVIFVHCCERRIHHKFDTPIRRLR